MNLAAYSIRTILKYRKTSEHMNNYKLHFPILLLILTGSFNITNAQTKVGLKAGVNFSNVIMKDEKGDKASTQSLPGFVVGLTADIPVIADFYVQPGFLYADKGFKQKSGGYYGLATDFKVNVSYLEVPVHILYKPALAGGKLLIGAGGYVGYGTGGTWESSSDVLLDDIMMPGKGDVNFKNDFKDGEFGNYLYGKPLDYGASFLLGYEFLDKLVVQLNSQVGLRNLQPEFDGAKRDGKLKNTSFGITLGYKF